MPWQLVLDDSFDRANTVAGAAGSTTGAGNGWIDVQGGVYRIDTSNLLATADAVDNNQWQRDQLVRPGAEDRLDQRVVAETTGTLGSNVVPDLVLRYQSASKNHYLLAWNTVNGGVRLDIFRVVAGAATLLASSAVLPNLTNRSHVYRLDGQARGSSPTQITFTVTNATTGVQVGTVNANDSTAGFQAATSCGLNLHSNPPGATSLLWQRARVYQWVAGATHPLATDPDVRLSPYNWYKDPGNAWVESPNPGAYLSADFTGTAAELLVDVSPLTGLAVAANRYPYLVWSIDDGPLQTAQLASTTTSLMVADFLAAGGGTHRLRLWVRSADPLYDAWTASASAYRVRLNGLILDSGADTVAPAQRAKQLLAYGDSILQGTYSRDATASYVGDSDALESWLHGVAEALDAEYGSVANGGGSWTLAAANSVPALFTPGNDASSSWNKHRSGVSRLVGGLFDPAPDYLLVCLGWNDAANGVAGATVQAAVSGFLAAARAAAGSACMIFVLVPPGGQSRANITAAVTAYQAANPADECHLIDLGATAEPGLTATALVAAGTAAARDGYHPNARTHMRLAALYADRIRQEIEGAAPAPGGTGSGSWGSVALF